MDRRTVSDIYPSKWLRADDLRGRAIKVQIETVTVQDLRQRDGETAPKICLSFVGAGKLLALNKTQAKALADLTGTEVFSRWPGSIVVLSPGRAPNGQPTVVVSAPAVAPGVDHE